MKPLYIFDLDGTLALIHHRRHLLETNKPDRWRCFFDACDKDLPNNPVIRTMELLRSSGADIRIFSGRSDEVRKKTVDWLVHFTCFTADELAENTGLLTMRAAHDYTADDLLKKRWLDAMSADDQKRLVAVFDDRDRVVKMWRQNGVACFQVAEGDF